ncbi:MAG: carboxyvinyl-carboxyphosphonate phosphorylmutase, partial [Rhodospirillales bacterium]|nr:carboxyvinyl-carboxyphosphonate phosphorylmutase [Rhodospirillales bacterium]
TYVVAKAMQDFMAHLASTGTTRGTEDAMLTFDAFNRIVGLEALREREEAYQQLAAKAAKKRSASAAE